MVIVSGCCSCFSVRPPTLRSRVRHTEPFGGARGLALLNGRVTCYTDTMAFEHEKRQALYLLQGIENGTLATAESARLGGEADPVLLYFIVTWLRDHYRNHPAAEGVLGRLVELSASPGIKRNIAEGKDDSLVAWFEDAYGYRDFDARGSVDLVVEKLES